MARLGRGFPPHPRRRIVATYHGPAPSSAPSPVLISPTEIDVSFAAITGATSYDLRANSNTYRQAVMADSPIAYWRLGESTGTTATSETGSYNATYVGSPALGVAGVLGSDRAVGLDGGGSQYLSVPAGLSTATSNTAITAEGWVYLDAAPIAGAAPSLITEAYGSPDLDVRFRVGVDETTGRFMAGFYNGSWRKAVDPSAITLGTWTHLAGTYDGATVRLYRNGVQVASLLYGGTLPSGSSGGWYIGRRFDLAETISGRVDEVAVYSTVLSASRLAAHVSAESDSSSVIAGVTSTYPHASTVTTEWWYEYRSVDANGASDWSPSSITILTPYALLTYTGDAPLTAPLTASFAGTIIQPASVAMGSPVGLSATGLITQPASAACTAPATLSAAGTSTNMAGTALTAPAALIGTGRQTVMAGTTLVAGASLAAGPLAIKFGLGTLVAPVILAADAVVTGPVTNTALAYATTVTQKSGVGGSWANLANAQGSTTSTYATFSSTASTDVAIAEASGYGVRAAIGPTPYSINSVSVSVGHYELTTAKWASVTAELWDGTTARIGSPIALTLSATTSNAQTVVFSGSNTPGWDQLTDLRVVLTATRVGTLTSSFNVDYIGVVTNYTPTSAIINVAASATFTATGTMATDTSLTVPAAASLIASGVLAARPEVFGAAILTGSGILIAAGLPLAQLAAGLIATGQIVATIQAASGAVLAGSGSLVAGIAVTTVGTAASLIAVGLLGSAAVRERPLATGLIATGSLTGVVLPLVLPTRAFLGTGTLTPAGVFAGVTVAAALIATGRAAPGILLESLMHANVVLGSNPGVTEIGSADLRGMAVLYINVISTLVAGDAIINDRQSMARLLVIPTALATLD